ncbi:MAG: DNA polymerase I [Treponema sp.]|nr:DNA polymerase I [Treponema sp.]MCL2272578.1 DNA polymerase I [Treponema sp.]
MKQPPLYLIDAYGLIYRSYFAFMTRPIRNSAGKNISALFGFARTLVSLIDDGTPAADDSGRFLEKPQKPLRLAAVFDSRTPTFRHAMYSEYKANRQKTPEDLHEQVPLVEEFLTVLGVQCLKADGFEADDIIATLAEKCRGEKRQCYILSSDKDLLQLVGGGIFELRPSKINRSEANVQSSGPVWDLAGPDEVKNEWGVEPEKILDLLSLTGDSSDNVPGVKGIGEKTAVKLMARYGSLDEIYRNIAAIEGSAGKKIAEGKESAYFSQSLIRLRCDVELPVKNIDDLSAENLNRSAGALMLLREGIRQSAKLLDPKIKTAGASPNANENSTGNENNKNEAADNSAASENASCADQSLLGEGHYKTILDIKELKAVLEQAKEQKLLALDFETDSLDAWNSHPIGISLALKPKEAYYAPLAPHDAENSPSAFLDPEKVRPLLRPLLSDREMTVVAHNAKFDYKVSRGWGIERWLCKIWDTMTAAWIADPERGNYSLDSLASYILDCTPVKYMDIVPKGKTFDTVTLETATHYSGEDSDYCLRLKHYYEKILVKIESLDLFENLEMPLLPILAEMEGEGIKIEPKALIEYGKELSSELDRIQTETWKLVGHEFNLSSTKQLQEVLFTERKLNPGKKTKTGYSTDAAALEELAREDPVPALILRHRTLSKLKSTYVDTLADMTDNGGRIHTSFVQTGTATGRLSSREPNLQNIPIRTEEGRRIREAFIAKPGFSLISADYSQIELVVLAHLSKDENLISAFREEKDVHARTAALIFGINESEVKSEQRRMAKTINFGVIYGMSAFRLANELDISRTEAQNFINAYFKTYSGVRQFIEETIKKTEQTGFVTTISGRRRYIPMINSHNKTEKAAAERITVNTPIQGSAADIVKTAMIKLDRRLLQEKSGARLLLQVHDELILECPQEENEKTVKFIKEEMELAANLSIPLSITIEKGNRWGDFH